MKSKEDIIYQWFETQEVVRGVAEKRIKRGKKVCAIIILPTIFITTLFFILFKCLFPDIDREIEKFFIFAFCAVGFYSFLTIVIFLLEPLRAKYAKVKYTITDDGIRGCKTGEGQKHFWKDVTSYSVSRDELFPEKKVVTLYFKGRTRRFYLPVGEKEEQIIDFLSNKIAVYHEEVEEYKKPKITVLHWVFLFLFSIVYYTFVIYVFTKVIPKEFVGFLILTVMFFGSGTVGLTILFGKEAWKNPHLKGYVAIINLVTFVILLLGGAIYGLFYFWWLINHA